MSRTSGHHREVFQCSVWSSFLFLSPPKKKVIPLCFDQCDKIGRFLRVICGKCSYKSSQNNYWIFGLFWKTLFFSENCCGHFLANFWKDLGDFVFRHLVTLALLHKTRTFDPKNWHKADSANQRWLREKRNCDIAKKLKKDRSSLKF